MPPSAALLGRWLHARRAVVCGGLLSYLCSSCAVAVSSVAFALAAVHHALGRPTNPEYEPDGIHQEGGTASPGCDEPDPVTSRLA